MRSTIRQPATTLTAPHWQLQTAKVRLSELVEAALRGEPQRITRRGKDAVMVVSEASFLALKQSAKHEASDFVAHLLAMPRKRVATTTAKIKSRASQLRQRDIEL